MTMYKEIAMALSFTPLYIDTKSISSTQYNVPRLTTVQLSSEAYTIKRFFGFLFYTSKRFHNKKIAFGKGRVCIHVHTYLPFNFILLSIKRKGTL